MNQYQVNQKPELKINCSVSQIFSVMNELIVGFINSEVQDKYRHKLLEYLQKIQSIKGLLEIHQKCKEIIIHQKKKSESICEQVEHLNSAQKTSISSQSLFQGLQKSDNKTMNTLKDSMKDQIKLFGMSNNKENLQVQDHRKTSRKSTNFTIICLMLTNR